MSEKSSYNRRKVFNQHKVLKFELFVTHVLFDWMNAKTDFKASLEKDRSAKAELVVGITQIGNLDQKDRV